MAASKKKSGPTAVADVGFALKNDPHSKFGQIKSFMRNIESEFMDVDKLNKDPYQYINKKSHKIEINPGVPYRSTSMDEVFEIRNELGAALGI